MHNLIIVAFVYDALFVIWPQPLSFVNVNLLINKLNWYLSVNMIILMSCAPRMYVANMCTCLEALLGDRRSPIQECIGPHEVDFELLRPILIVTMASSPWRLSLII